MEKSMIVGVGMTRFGRHPDKHFTELGAEAIEMALEDANMDFREIQEAFCSRVYLPSATGARIMERMGRTGISCPDVEGACGAAVAGWGRAEYIRLLTAAHHILPHRRHTYRCRHLPRRPVGADDAGRAIPGLMEVRTLDSENGYHREEVPMVLQQYVKFNNVGEATTVMQVIDRFNQRLDLIVEKADNKKSAGIDVFISGLDRARKEIVEDTFSDFLKSTTGDKSNKLICCIKKARKKKVKENTKRLKEKFQW